jgi:hypothetical protein
MSKPDFSNLQAQIKPLNHTIKAAHLRLSMFLTVRDLDVENASWEDTSSVIKVLKEYQLLAQVLFLNQDVVQTQPSAQISLTQTNGIAQPAIPIRYLLNKLVHL